MALNLISPKIAKLIEILPEGMVRYIGRKIMFGYVDKFANLTVEGMENSKIGKRPTIFICNHLSNSDGLVLSKLLFKEDVTFVAGIKLTDDPVTKLAIIISKTTLVKPNTADKEGISKIINIIKNGGRILIFPEGTRSRNGKMIKAKKGIFLIAKLTGSQIIPIGIAGTEKMLPVNIDGDMGHEKFHNADVTVKFGKAIQLPDKIKGEDRHQYEERAVDTLMYAISELLPEEYRGEYSFNKQENEIFPS